MLLIFLYKVKFFLDTNPHKKVDLTDDDKLKYMDEDSDWVTIKELIQY